MVQNVDRQIEAAVSKFKPNKARRFVSLPVTFHRNSDSKSNLKTAVLIGLISFVVCLLITVFIFLSKMFVLFKLFWVGLIWFVFTYIFNFWVMKGKLRRNGYIEILDRDFELVASDFYSVLEVEDKYPYVHHTQNNMRVVFLRFQKDVKEGKGADSEHFHYEAIGNMLRRAYEEGLYVRHFDYMENIGEDKRTEDIYRSIAAMKDKNAQTLISRIFSNLERYTSSKFATFDVYAFATKDATADMTYIAKTMGAEGLNGNYKNYMVLDRESTREMMVSFMGLDTFSTQEAVRELVKEEHNKKVRVLRVTNKDGYEEVVNLSRKEHEAERSLKMAEQSEKNAKVKGRGRAKTPVEVVTPESADDLLDISSDTGEIVFGDEVTTFEKVVDKSKGKGKPKAKAKAKVEPKNEVVSDEDEELDI